MKSVGKINKNIRLAMDEQKTRKEQNLVWTSITIGAWATALAILFLLLFHLFNIDLHPYFLYVRYSILGAAIIYGMIKLKNYLPMVQSRYYVIGVGLLIAVTMVLGVMVINIFFTFLDGQIIMDRVVKIGSPIQLVIIEMDLMLNALVFGLLFSLLISRLFMATD